MGSMVGIRLTFINPTQQWIARLEIYVVQAEKHLSWLACSLLFCGKHTSPGRKFKNRSVFVLIYKPPLNFCLEWYAFCVGGSSRFGISQLYTILLA